MTNPKSSLPLILCLLQVIFWLPWMYFAFSDDYGISGMVSPLNSPFVFWLLLGSAPYVLISIFALLLVPFVNLGLSLYLIAVLLAGGRREYLGYVKTTVYEMCGTIGILLSVVAIVLMVSST